MIGQLLDRRYRITQRLSAGGFSETYLAQDTRIPGEPLCVVKRLKPANTNPNHLEKARQLFNREAEALAQLGNHEQIPRLLAYFTEEDEFFLVQEFIEGQTLEIEFHAEPHWSELQVIELLQEVLTVLRFVHAQGVIHRDIKPSNLIRRQYDKKLVLIDFGAIKQVQLQPDGSGEFSVATPGTRIGTIGYMPTEQARGKPRPSSDLYALGMIGIQALTGVYPSQLQDDSQTGEVLWQNLVQVSPGLSHILTQMTRYHFRDRYQSAAEVLEAIEQLKQSSYPPTMVVPKVGAGMEMVPELTLEWIDAGHPHTQVIYPQQPSRHPGSIRIGRDPGRCDIVLTDITVSGLHIEIFFQPQEQQFYVRNLRDTNPPAVDGQLLFQAERLLRPGSRIQLGQIELRVSTIMLQSYPDGQPFVAGGIQFPAPVPSPIAPTGKASPAVPLQYRQEALQHQRQGLDPAIPVRTPSVSVSETTRPRLTQPDWLIGLLWLGATIASMTITGAIASTGRGFLTYPPLVSHFFGNLLIGVTVGGAQWLVLRSRMPRLEWWILVTAVGLAVGALPGLLLPDPLYGLMTGLLVGTAQWLLLQPKVDKAGWWIVAQTLSFFILWELPLVIENLLARLLIGSLITGVLTGAVMVWLLRLIKQSGY